MLIWYWKQFDCEIKLAVLMNACPFKLDQKKEYLEVPKKFSKRYLVSSLLFLSYMVIMCIGFSRVLQEEGGLEYKIISAGLMSILLASAVNVYVLLTPGHIAQVVSLFNAMVQFERRMGKSFLKPRNVIQE